MANAKVITHVLAPPHKRETEIIEFCAHQKRMMQAEKQAAILKDAMLRLQGHFTSPDKKDALALMIVSRALMAIDRVPG